VAGLGEATIHGLAHGVALREPVRPAISIDGVELTHGALDDRASLAAGWLAAHIAPGDRVLIAGAASLDWAACYLGTLRAGGVAVLANPAYTAAELDELIGASGARLAVAWGEIPLVRYGTTESGLDTSHVYHEPRELGLSGTIGVPLPGLEVRLAGEDGAEVEAGADGEIQLRGPQVFGGYWGDVEATAAAFAAEGWFRTGDIGGLDSASGHLVIRGRSKEVIVSGGMNVFPREVEIVLEKHPSVEEAAVAGITDERWGEQVTAWVVLEPGHALDADALIAHARSMLAAYKCPKQVFSLHALPHNRAGKVDRRKLRASAGSPKAR